MEKWELLMVRSIKKKTINYLIENAYENSFFKKREIKHKHEYMAFANLVIDAVLKEIKN